MFKYVLLCIVILFSVYSTEQAGFSVKDRIQKVNQLAKTWKAQQHFSPRALKEFIQTLGSLVLKRIPKKLIKENDPLYINDIHIPPTFDARIQWSNCTTIGEVREQGKCGNCWAQATAGAFSDRLCIGTNGQFNKLISTEELTFCCYSCGIGCHGGNPILAWQYFKRRGVVTGGNYNTTDGCQPYKVPPCQIDDQGLYSCNEQPKEKHHKCIKGCYGDTSIDFNNNHWKTKNAYYLSYGNMQKDVLAYGPIETSLEIYDDFPHYKSGIYQKTPGAKRLGAHAVKLIGWGEENGVPYWLLVNSWSKNWGDRGLFKIIRGQNECGIETGPTAGEPLV
ncbi:Cysteine peptidase, cysteine active site,Peptidase C1A, papain C-terminal,Cysteine peptidase [Cinara cedri]|uniref:Cysteine peptidase, cysteine active site,Peptidase C1A, papain C-terminal,Cysteine peptidase n=1 Tax=Cinara cedri TaxID=506608 RepID=A0A5E4M4K8_9HEMI|nr:Cysteine peptidase, cysteine active site,Peptidase C1A, papain C-terminal,Cysteine peptidase [Cinara cedri]